MIKFLLIMVAAFFCIIGVCESMHSLWLLFIKPRDVGASQLIVFTSDGNFNEQFDYYFEKYRWEGSAFADGMVFLHNGDVPVICKKYETVYPHIHFCKYGNLHEIFKNIGEDNAGQ